jgi:DNA-binding response OmpR family regulator
VENSDQLAEFLVKALKDSGFSVQRVSDAEAARDMLQDDHYDAMLLDLGSAGKGTVQQNAQALRRYAYQLPIIFMGRDEEKDDIVDLTGDEAFFLRKPFSMEEMVARVKSVAPQVLSGAPVSFGDLVLDIRTLQLRSNGKFLPLTRKEAALLETLMRHPNIIVDRNVIERALYGGNNEVGPNALEVLVSRLRKKLMAGNVDIQLLTVRGAGYMLMSAR